MDNMNKEELAIIEQKLGRSLKTDEVNLIEELAAKSFISTEAAYVEPKPSLEDQTLEEIRSQPDCEEIQIRPEKDNPFKNISQIIIRSKTLGKQVVMDFTYTDIFRDGKLVGREGGITKVTISDLSGVANDNILR